MLPREVREPCRAKLNLYLDVVGRRRDGYHEIVTVFHEIGLADELLVRRIDADEPRTVRLVLCPQAQERHAVPDGPENLAVRAASLLLRDAGSNESVELRLTKRIPVGSGLGGGSADAAGALRAVDKLLGLGTSVEELEALALEIGSDVPFLVQGGAAIGRGRGEVLEPIPTAAGLRYLLLLPPFEVATAAVYAALETIVPPPGHIGRVRRALETGDGEALAAATYNALLEPALAVEPRLRTVLDAARSRIGEHVQMSGSGSALFLPLGESTPPAGTYPLGTRGEIVKSA